MALLMAWQVQTWWELKGNGGGHMCETGKRQFMRSPLTESEKAIGKASSTIAYVLNLSGAHAPMETMQQIGRQDPVAGRLGIVHDVNGGFQHYPSRLERKLDDDKKLADELEKVCFSQLPQHKHLSFCNAQVLHIAQAANDFRKQHQWLAVARGLNCCGLYSDKDYQGQQENVQNAKNKLDEAEKKAQSVRRQAKDDREKRDTGAVGDRCFVTFRYTADASAAVQAFSPWERFKEAVREFSRSPWQRFKETVGRLLTATCSSYRRSPHPRRLRFKIAEKEQTKTLQGSYPGRDGSCDKSKLEEKLNESWRKELKEKERQGWNLKQQKELAKSWEVSFSWSDLVDLGMLSDLIEAGTCRTSVKVGGFESDDVEEFMKYAVAQRWRVTRAREVDNIRWENLSTPAGKPRSSSWMWLLTTAISLLVLWLVAFPLIYEFNSKQLLLARTGSHHGSLRNDSVEDSWLSVGVSKVLAFELWLFGHLHTDGSADVDFAVRIVSYTVTAIILAINLSLGKMMLPKAVEWERLCSWSSTEMRLLTLSSLLYIGNYVLVLFAVHTPLLLSPAHTARLGEGQPQLTLFDQATGRWDMEYHPTVGASASVDPDSASWVSETCWSLDVLASGCTNVTSTGRCAFNVGADLSHQACVSTRHATKDAPCSAVSYMQCAGAMWIS